MLVARQSRFHGISGMGHALRVGVLSVGCRACGSVFLSQIKRPRCSLFNDERLTKEIIMSADTVAPELFGFLDATHREIQQQLSQLHALVDAIESNGLNAATRAQARGVLDYFNGEARQHHLDEEKHIFPALLGSQIAEIVQAAERLTQDHGWLEENWIQIAPSLEAATNGNLWFDPVELRHALEVFEALYLDHILLEESIAYPAARQRLAAHNTHGMGREMARRRFRADSASTPAG